MSLSKLDSIKKDLLIDLAEVLSVCNAATQDIPTFKHADVMEAIVHGGCLMITGEQALALSSLSARLADVKERVGEWVYGGDK